MAYLEIEEQEEHQQIIINGVPHEQVTKHCISFCGHCKTPLLNFNGNKVEVIKHLANEQNRALKYCINCGEKLIYPEIIDGQCVVINENVERNT